MCSSDLSGSLKNSGERVALSLPDSTNGTNTIHIVALDRIEARLHNRENYADSENIAYLGDCIRKLAMGSVFQIRERIEVYDHVQNTLLSIPGHAEYFGRRIREANEPLKGPEYGKLVHEARNERMYGFQTLSNLPSPETVKVLGEMLSDTWRKEFNPPPGSEDVVPPPNSLALDAIDKCLQSLPLRDPPSVPRLMAWDDPEDVLVHPWQSWWKEIKSGKRTFSFKGQAVEYRFKPDETWETLAMANPPDDGPRAGAMVAPPEPTPRPVKPTLPRPTPQAPPPSRGYWWLIGCFVSALGAVAFLLKRRHAS